MPKRSLKKTLINNLTSRRRESSQERLEENRHHTQTGQVSQTSHSQDSYQENLHERSQVSARPTRAAKVRCSQNMTDIIQAERSYNLDVSRERASQRLAIENEEQRERSLLQDMRQRAAQRVAAENQEERDRRLHYLRQQAAKRVERIATENDEQPGQPDDVVDITSEEPIEFIPTKSLQNSVEHLPESPPSTSRTKDMPIPKKKSFRKIYCRLCLEQTTNNHMNHLMIMDLNYVGKSEVKKFNKIMQIQRINSMIRVVMPAFDYDLAYNPIICHRCVLRLESAYKFITMCEDSEKAIRQYKEQFSPNELVSCDDVAEGKSLFVKPGVRTYGNDSVASRRVTRPPVPSKVDQTDQLPDVGSGSRESQENPTPDTNLDASGLVKCETQEEEYNDEGAGSPFAITSEELSCIVKEEIVMKEDVPYDFCDTSAKKRLDHPETNLTIKDEDTLSVTCGTSEYDGYHTDTSGNQQNYKGIRTYQSVGKKRKEMGDTT